MEFKNMTKEQLKALKAQIQAELGLLGGKGNGKAEKARLTAEELKPFTDNIIAAKEAYESKGFIVEIKTNKNGLVTKWALKRNNTIGAEKAMSVDEFRKILVRLGDKEFSSRDIKNALIGSGIGDRKLQPTLGLILKGMHGDIGVQKVDGVDKGPGVRYIKVQ